MMANVDLHFDGGKWPLVVDAAMRISLIYTIFSKNSLTSEDYDRQNKRSLPVLSNCGAGNLKLRMSTFSGKIQELLQISVDRFDGENVESEAYFLSHCHTDHMVGLSSFYFQEQLVKTSKNLYASEISCVILRKMFPYIAGNLKELHLYSPTTVHLRKYSFSVTLISAGHCPGSVMFLFEGGKRILYTGDYRINKHDTAKFKSFYNSANEIKLIDKIYLDTTFFLKSYLNFPKREESLKELCEIVEEWIQRGKQFLVKLETSAKYGYEYIFSEIFKKFNMPVHVNKDMHAFYSLIPEMDMSVTMDGSITQIHCNCGVAYQQMCDFRLDSYLKIIKISAFRWKQDDLKEGSSNFVSGVHYVCFSTHASYEEGVELIRLLKPKEIEACVKHNDPYANKEMKMLIQEHLAEFKPKEEIKEMPKLFPVRSITSPKGIGFKQSFDELNILNSPPRDTIDLDITVVDSKEGKLHCERNSGEIINEIVSPVRKVRISDSAFLVGTSQNSINWKSEIIEDRPRDCEIEQDITIQSTLPTLNNVKIEQNKRKHEIEDCMLLRILDLQSDISDGMKHSQSDQDPVENSKGSLESIECKKEGLYIENLEGFKNKIEKLEPVDETDKYKVEEREDSILMSIIDTPPQVEMSEVKGSEECNIILSIIDSPPNKKKK